MSGMVTSIIAIGALCMSIYLYSTSHNVAYVNNTRVLTEYNGLKEGSQLYQQKRASWKANIDTLNNSLNREIKKYEAERASLTAKEQQLTEALLGKRQQELINYKNAIQQKAKEDDQQIMDEIVKQIDSYIKNYGEEHGYDYIFGVTSEGNLLFANDTDNITDAILEGLNRSYEGN